MAPNFPLKELVVAVCFAAGAALAASSGRFEFLPPGIFLSLVLLAFGNCLLIARAEADYDHHEDPAAFYSAGARSTHLPEYAIIGSIVFAVISLLRIGATPALPALILSGAATLILARSRSPLTLRQTQPIADAIQWIPWLVVAAVGLAGGRH